jgi:hypothetical protein
MVYDFEFLACGGAIQFPILTTGTNTLFANIMKTILSALMILTSSLVAQESLHQGLFIPDREAAGKIEVKAGEIVHRQKAKRLKPDRVTFRPDTEDPEKFWLELEFSVLVDPGDYYVFMIGDRTYEGFVVRGIEPDRCKWALGFQDRKLGRELLQKIGEIYDLPKADIEDKT